MLNKLWTTVAAIILVAHQSADARQVANKFAAQWERGGIVRLSDGTRVTRVNLSDDIVGCLGQLYDRSTGEKFGPGEGRSRVLDVTELDGHRYILLTAVAAPNCNVQGRCGAGDSNVTLIWLDVAPDLSVASKKAFTVEDCVEARWVDDERDDWRDKVGLVDGRLTIKFKEFDRSSSERAEISGRVTYERRDARIGFVVSRAAQH